MKAIIHARKLLERVDDHRADVRENIAYSGQQEEADKSER